ncbi:MAG: hypothetical protein ACRD1T_07335, partial [Acidimicrobiia bacterium]
WAVTGVGIGVMIVGITLFGRYVLAIENWPAIVTTLVGLFLVGFGFRSARGMAMNRSVLVSTGIFLLLLSAYALFRVDWRILAAPQTLLLVAAGIALVAIGSRRLRDSAARTPTV